jgi:integrase
VTIPLAPRTARAIDLAIGERTGGAVFLAADGKRLDRRAAGRIVRRTARRAGIAKLVTAYAAARVHYRSLPVSTPGVPLRDVQEAASHADPRTTMRYNHQIGPAAAWTATPPTVPPCRPGRRDNLPGGGGSQEGGSRSPALQDDHAPLLHRER